MSKPLIEWNVKYEIRGRVIVERGQDTVQARTSEEALRRVAGMVFKGYEETKLESATFTMSRA